MAGGVGGPGQRSAAAPMPSGPTAPGSGWCEPPPGLPPGVIDLAAGHWSAAGRAAGAAGLQPPALGPGPLRRRLVAELTAPLRLEDWPAPNQARPVAGGWIHDEVIDADRDGFETALMSWFRDGPERVAAAAQELRWPVTPYRPLPSVAPPVGGETPVGATASRPAGRGRAGRRPPVVVDLTTHWAGPLATSLLAEAGAEVVKVDPEVRPDGFRSRPRLYHHLNRAKEVVDLDLREAGDRHRFEVLVAGADLLVESFSRRVLPNLGYDRDLLHHLNPGLATLSVRAFPTGTAEADWLAYGPGVHAASGLGLVSGSPTPAPIAYPDLVAGVAAYRRGVELLAGLVGPGRPGPGTAGTAEISLSGAIAPLVAEAVRRRDPSGRSDGSERGRTNG